MEVYFRGSPAHLAFSGATMFPGCTKAAQHTRHRSLPPSRRTHSTGEDQSQSVQIEPTSIHQ